MRRNVEAFLVHPVEGDFSMAELWIDNELVAMTTFDQGEREVLLFPRSDGEPWRLRVDDLHRLLQLESRLSYGPVDETVAEPRMES
jgi:hypothetical protein